MSLNVTAGSVTFGGFRFDRTRHALYRGDSSVPLGARALDVLGALTLGIAHAHMFTGGYEDCVRWSRRVIAEKPEWTSPRRLIPVALAHLGRHDEARTEIGALLALQPNSSMARARTSCYRESWMHELYLEGLQRAGLPEHSRT